MIIFHPTKDLETEQRTYFIILRILHEFILLKFFKLIWDILFKIYKILLLCLLKKKESQLITCENMMYILFSCNDNHKRYNEIYLF